jgi:predicted phage terminase large subunit-like protein
MKVPGIDLLNSDVDLVALQKALTPRLTKYIPFDPTTKQTAFLIMNDVREILYGGAAGGGKSVAQLMGALQYADIPGYNAILFRKTYADLAKPGALLDMAKQWLMPFVERKEVKWSEKEKRFTFQSGATLTFGYLESENDMYNYQGAEYQYIGMDECTQINPKCYRYLFSRLRKPKWLKVPLRFRATANPGGEFGEYYYERFFVEGPEKGRVFIPAGIDDNPYLDSEEYKQSLAELDPVTREQLLNGNWQIREAGDMFNREWFTIVSHNEIPSNAIYVRYWDMASTDPSKRKNKKDKREPDWTVGLKMAFSQGIYWIIDIVMTQSTPSQVESLIARTASSDGHNVAIRMEQEPGSSGDITIDHYARNVLVGYNFKGVRSTGSKIQRAEPASAAAEQGRILISNRCRNISAFFDQIELFPYGAKDDIVDAFSGAFNYFRGPAISVAPSGIGNKGSYWKRAY